MQANRRPLAGTMHKLAREEQYKADTFTYQGNPEKNPFLSHLVGYSVVVGLMFFFILNLCASQGSC
jgi:hypothetical protein